MSQLNRGLLSRLEKVIDKETWAGWLHAYSSQQQNEHKKMQTPATNCTNSSCNAIDNFRRIKKGLKGQEQEALVRQSLRAKAEQEAKDETTAGTKLLIKHKAVFFGECQLPYLQSSDAISQMYAQTVGAIEAKQVLFNPPSSLERSVLTGLKSLHIYHSSIQSLRQLGTGWCNLKQLSILYGNLVDISGLSSFSSLEYLFVAFNQISSLSDLMFHPTIRCLDLEKNRIANMEEVEYLATMDKLESINLNGNPIVRVKENKRLLQDKLGRRLEVEEYGRLQDYENEQLTNLHELISYEDIQISNHLVRTCNEGVRHDDITLENLYDHYQSGQQESTEKSSPLQFVRYEKKMQRVDANDKDELQMNEEQEEVIFTPIIHFLPTKKYYSNILQKYLQNRLYINTKAKQGQSPAVGRLSQFTASTKLDRGSEVYSLDKKEIVSNELNALDKGKIKRLSLGKTRRLFDRFDKTPTSSTQPLKFMPNFSATLNPSTSKTLALKRTSLLRKPSVPQIDIQIQKKFAKTAQFNCD